MIATEQAGLTATAVTWTAEAGGADARVVFKDTLPPHHVEVKGDLVPARLGPVLARLRTVPAPRLLVARHMTPPMGERLRAEGVQFVDTAGNAFLEQTKPLVHVWIVGRRPLERTGAQRPVKAFRAAGLRVIFPLLCDPDAVNAPLRDIADMAGVALGTVAQTMAALRQLGYLRDARAGRELERRDRLIDAWVDAYPRELRPLLKPRRFKVADPDWWKCKGKATLGVWLGGEPAAALLTEHLRPEVATVYDGAAFAQLARAIRPAKDDHGNLELLDRFWNFDPPQLVPGYRLAPPLLVYADLLATADARNLETAAVLREKYLG
jgi:hypothetical protein